MPKELRDDARKSILGRRLVKQSIKIMRVFFRFYYRLNINKATQEYHV